MSKAEVVMCQRNICQGKSCKHFGQCNHRMYRKEPVKAKEIVCPECGHKNNPDNINCDACDYPINIKGVR